MKLYKPEPYKPFVSRMPLAELWRHDGAPVPAKRVRWLVSDEVHDRVKQRPDLDLVVARGGERLQWLYGDKKWTFWKEELKEAIADPEGPNQYLEDDELYYVVSEWSSPGIDRPILLAERHSS